MKNTVNKSLFAALLAMITITAGCKKETQPPPTAPVPVIAAEVIVRDQPIYIEFIGQTLGSRDVEIRARVEGFLKSVNFTEGKTVISNELLYTIDDLPFIAAMNQASGKLAQAEAQWDKSCRDTNRLGSLWAQDAVSYQQYDDALAAEQNAAAILQSAQASVDSARIQLEYTKIFSPITGLVGKTEVKPGNLVGRGTSTLLTTVSDIDPISVRFSVSEQQYLAWKRQHGNDERSRAAAEGLFELILADGTVHQHRGKVSFADRQVDPQTGTLLLEVSFPNPEELVRPGQFGRVRFPIEVVTNAVLVPQRAVTQLQATYSVFVAGADNRAEFRRIVPGPRVGSFYVVNSGLNPGEKIVVDGIQKLQNNVPIASTFTNLVAEVPTVRTSNGN